MIPCLPGTAQAKTTQHGATLYTIQLALNLMWTPLYFGLGKPIPATVDILALGGTLAYLISVWGQVDPTCGWLLAPYLGSLRECYPLVTYLSRWKLTFVDRPGQATSTTGTSGPSLRKSRENAAASEYQNVCISNLLDW